MDGPLTIYRAKINAKRNSGILTYRESLGNAGIPGHSYIFRNSCISGITGKCRNSWPFLHFPELRIFHGWPTDHLSRLNKCKAEFRNSCISGITGKCRNSWLFLHFPEFVHIGNHWEMQEFLVMPAFSGITNISSSCPHPHPHLHSNPHTHTTPSLTPSTSPRPSGRNCRNCRNSWSFHINAIPEFEIGIAFSSP
jgi:hypothetical protein